LKGDEEPLFGEVWVEEGSCGWRGSMGGAVGGSGGERTADVYMRLMDASVLERR
jgi:hypothetical protein